MTALVGGVGALILGVILLIVWFDQFLTVLAGLIPMVLLLGGALAAYLGLEEMRDRRQIEEEMARANAQTTPPPTPAASQEELDRHKEEAAKYKAEVEELKNKLKDQSEDKETSEA